MSHSVDKSGSPANSGHDAHSAHDAHDAEHIAAHIAGYMKVGAALLLLTAVTVGLSYVDFGSRSTNIIVGMIVATFKAGLVAAIFMHLKGEKLTIWRFLIFTTIFVLGLFLLTYFSNLDPISGTYYNTH
jgi:cytochrome c oxidase subunit 4